MSDDDETLFCQIPDLDFLISLDRDTGLVKVECPQIDLEVPGRSVEEAIGKLLKRYLSILEGAARGDEEVEYQDLDEAAEEAPRFQKEHVGARSRSIILEWPYAGDRYVFQLTFHYSPFLPVREDVREEILTGAGCEVVPPGQVC